jgi:hypothetical protein
MLYNPLPQRPDRDSSTRILLDGDYLPYQAGNIVKGGSLDHAKNLIWRQVDGICNLFNTEHIEIYLTGPGNFREEIAVTRPYKGNRDDSKRPYHYAALREYMLDDLSAVLISGHEADDEVCIRQRDCHIDGIPSVICSPDKDLKNMYGWNYSPLTEVTQWITAYDAARHFYYQSIVGDLTVDNIEGILGSGDAVARKVFDEYTKLDDIEAKIRQLYHQKHGDAGDTVMLEMGRLLHMKRTPTDLWGFDYDWHDGYNEELKDANICNSVS